MELTNSQQPKTKDFVVLLLSILLIISCLVAGFFAYKTQSLVKEITKLRSIQTPIVRDTPTPDPTADWKTYTNDELSISFRYPAQWSAKYKDFQNTDAIVEFEYKNTPIFYIIDDNKIYSSIEKYLGNQNVLSSDITLDNKPAKKISVAGDDGHITSFKRILYLSKNKNVVDLNYIWPYFDEHENDRTFDLILSTFKFTKSEASSSPLPVLTSPIKCPE